MPELTIWLPMALALPLLKWGHSRGLFEHRWAAWALAGVATLCVALLLPSGGMSLDHLKITKGGLALSAALLLWARARGQAFAIDPANFRRALIALTGFAVLAYFNFGALHGQRSFLHLHDLAHYYIGAKYYAELGPDDLYKAMLRAESEWTGDRFKAIEARDLENDQLVHIRSLLQQSEAVKAAFSEQRWEQFQQDTSFFRDALGPQYTTLLRDHGFNATPVWALLGSPLANLVSPGRDSGMFWLALLDPLLIAATLAAVGWAFGVDALLLTLLYWCLLFGAGFAWTGGSFLRVPWLAALIGSLCCVKRERHTTAGALLALSAGLRVFPLLFAIPLLASWIGQFRATGAIPRSARAFAVGMIASGLLLIAATALLPRGWGHWSEAQARLTQHADVLSPNLVGLTRVIAYRPDTGPVTRDELRAIRNRHEDIRTVQLWAIALPLFLWILRRAPDKSVAGSFALAIPLIFASLSLASYYAGFWAVLLLLYQRSPGLLAALFAVEAASHATILFGAPLALQHVVRSGLLALVCAALLFARAWSQPLTAPVVRTPLASDGSPRASSN